MTGRDLIVAQRSGPLGTWNGMRLLMEVGGCDPAVIRDRTALSAWTREVTAQAGMVPFGAPLMKHFGHDELAGETVIRMTRTGNADVHGFDEDQSVTLCVNSRTSFDPAATLEFTKKFFDSDTVRARVVESHIPPAGTRDLVVEARDDTLGTWRGMRLLVDLGGCDPAVVRSSNALGHWISTLAKRIDMVTVGQPLVRRTSDFVALMQLIETSNIDVWGFGDPNAVHACAFSCKPFDPEKALDYTTQFFDAASVRARVVHCYIPA